jgi:hypothetical protein
VCDQAAEGVEDEALERVVVKGAAGVGDVEAVMPGVDVLIGPFVDVEGAVPKVLPGVKLRTNR